jgi:copper chaperone CopZ
MSTTRDYAVTGLTCDHCVHAVSTEVSALPGVENVQIALNAGGVSTVTVASAEPLSESQLEAALDEAGEYHLAN